MAQTEYGGNGYPGVEPDPLNDETALRDTYPGVAPVDQPAYPGVPTYSQPVAAMQIDRKVAPALTPGAPEIYNSNYPRADPSTYMTEEHRRQAVAQNM